ncbi:MAG: hypothetical protein IPK33_03050 [Gemmatimonadetes bacterium]|nr:hypothetical protein [Gemmatimonadota bacterium]
MLRATYAATVTVRRDNAIAGIDGTALIRVRTNRLSRMSLQARSRDGIDVVTLDSVAAALDTTLQLRVGRSGRVMLRAGEYDFVVSLNDPRTGEAIIRRFAGIAVVPAIDYLPEPAVLDSSEYLPERAPSQRTGGIVGAVLIGAATVALGEALRAAEPIKGSGTVDSRYRVVGFTIALGAGAAAWFDRGRLLDRNARENRKREVQFAAKLRAARTENARRAAEYRASVSLDPEGR